MKILSIFSVLLAAGAAWFYMFGSNIEGGEVEAPTEYASDFWSVWERWESEEGSVVHRFSSISVDVNVYHVESEKDLSEFSWYHENEMEVLSYRGGFLVGAKNSLDKWVDLPGEMSKKWTISSNKYICLTRLNDGRFKLQSGKDKIVFWDHLDVPDIDPEVIDGFTFFYAEDRIVYTRVVEKNNIEKVEVENFSPTIITQETLGVTRNHRNREDMDVVWNAELNAVQAVGSGGDVVWSKALKNGIEPVGLSFEVDLYGNNKYQTAFAVSSAIYLVDVLGNDVSGFPYEVDGVTSLAVFDYDHNDKFRFIIATENGRLYNIRGEGNNTPGWNFNTLKDGVSIKHLAHLRVGIRDYIYAGCSDGSVKLLMRNGQIRDATSVIVNPDFAPAIRLSSTIGKSSVLFIDEAGWVQELTLSDAKQVGMSGVTRAHKVSLIDMDGDGVKEVVTEHNGLMSVFNTRNEKIN